MSTAEAALLAGMIFAAAFLYSSVGHAGASGYIAAMALFGLHPDVMKPTALCLNILVASIAIIRFGMQGHFSWRSLWPFLIGSAPFAFVGGALQVPSRVYGALVGFALLVAAWRLAVAEKTPTPSELKNPPIAPAIGWGILIGLLSGVTGTGGGIFLSPLLIFAGWADPKKSGGISAAFILVNSITGLAGRLSTIGKLPAELPYWAAAAVAGGLIGATLGSKRFKPQLFRRMLAVVLVIAAGKLLFA